MKKLLCTLLALSMLLGLAACGNGSQGNSESPAPGGETGGHFERLADLRGLGALFGRQVNIA